MVCFHAPMTSQQMTPSERIRQLTIEACARAERTRAEAEQRAAKGRAGLPAPEYRGITARGSIATAPIRNTRGVAR